jgi:hypothetical protein
MLLFGEAMATSAARPGLPTGANQWYRPTRCEARKPCEISKLRRHVEGPTPSAKTPSWDILFPLLIRGRNPAECGHSWQIVRTTGTGLTTHFGPLFVSLRPFSLTQPNHSYFGTDVKNSWNQLLRGRLKRCGSKGARSGGVSWYRTIRFSATDSRAVMCAWWVSLLDLTG